MAKLGIDLGTSNSAAAVVFGGDEKKPFTVEPIDGPLLGDLVFPSYVAFNTKGEVTAAGFVARERFFNYGQSDLVVRHFKRLIGRPFDYVIEKINQKNRAFFEFKDRIKRSGDGSILLTVGDRDISIVEIASCLLRKIVEDSQAFVQKWGEKIDSAVVTLPAGFDDSQRQATTEATKLAGLQGIDITVIEEPTAAAVARGLGGMGGNIMVVDVGAGTTDVIIGYMEQTEDGSHLMTTGRDYDDVLGGIDMDNRILGHVFRNDSGSPRLEDVFYEGMQASQRLRLMGKIEEAKIVASRDGAASISINLSVGKAEQKRISLPLTEITLSEIVKPTIDGEEANGQQKGVRPVVERALLKAAGGNLANIPKVVGEIDWLILVGGPCRMSCMHQMLRDIFKGNSNIVMQIDNLDRTDRLIKEAVAQGAALSQIKGVEVTASVPWTVSILHESGLTPVIAAATPYTRGEGTDRSVTIPATQGSNLLWILSQKENHPTRDWSMHCHIVNVPQEGKLKVSLTWGEGGVETDRASVQGCGLPGNIDFPQVRSNNTTLGVEFGNRYKWYVSAAKDLRRLIGLAREPLTRWLMYRGWPLSLAEKQAGQLLEVPEADLERCDGINVDAEHLTDEEIETGVKMGYLRMRSQTVTERGFLSARAAEVLDTVVLPLLMNQTPVTPSELISQAYRLLDASRNCSACMQFWQQLSEWSHRLELVPNDHGVGSATATALGALADCLHDQQQVVSDEEFRQIQDMCWRFHCER